LTNFYGAANQCSVNSVANAQAGIRNHGGGGPTGAAAANKDPLINLQAFRLMYSPLSKIITVHFIVLNPFNLSDIKARKDGQASTACPFPSANGDVNSQEKLSELK
jgi:hypothetical protein